MIYNALLSICIAFIVGALFVTNIFFIRLLYALSEYFLAKCNCYKCHKGRDSDKY